MADRPSSSSSQTIFSALHERVKELNCLYRVEEILSNYDLALEDVFRQIIEAIPPGWRYPEFCQVRITYGNEIFESPDFIETPYVLQADIRVQNATVGHINVYYRQELPEGDLGPFLKGENKLIETIADRIGHYILHQRLRQIYEEMSTERCELRTEKSGWQIALNLLRNTDPNLLIRISRKMMNYLGWRGVDEARDLLHRFSADMAVSPFLDSNIPLSRESLDRFLKLSEETFRLAAANLKDDEILSRIQKWINEDRISTVVSSLGNVNADLNSVLESMRRIKKLSPEGIHMPKSSANSVRVSLIQRFFTDQLDYINIAKKYIDLENFFELMERIVFTPGSHGKLGGKSAGLFLAYHVLKQAARHNAIIGEIKQPKTWYIPSDGLLVFVQYNNLDEVIEQKYKDIDEVRQEYPHLIQVFKNSAFPPDIVRGLSVVLDDLGDVPLIVRSSSLLEDRLGSAFAGKYKSLFLANRGNKSQNLEALLDAIAEVYASTFSPAPIQYRAERGLLDFYEEMGIMIQPVVGQRLGRYYFPAFAGVAFSRNEFRWSPRIRREDGLVRIVPGLGTRAVDRLSDDYPVLISPGQPNLRVNISAEERVWFSPKKIDLIDLEENRFITKDIKSLLAEVGPSFPAFSKVFSLYRAGDGILQRPMGLAIDLEKSEAVATFEGLISTTPLMPKLEAILKTLELAFGVPVDVEFASDGKDFYLLQCRPQSYSAEELAMEIPVNIPEEDLIFTARKYISNGMVNNITHIVYVDPENYGELPTLQDLHAVGEAVGRLNKILPKRQFVLIGPGRWGSRGDIKLGVRVDYSGINNTAMLIEVARKKGSYVPEVSFGTHFFQDLVEAGIRYLPLYPDESANKFNDHFFQTASNKLSELLPEYSHISDTLKVICIPEVASGKILRILMNAEQELAVAYLAKPSQALRTVNQAPKKFPVEGDVNKWKLRVVEALARRLAENKFGIKGLYLIETNDDAAESLDRPIKLVVHFTGNARQRHELETWLEGWSHSLEEVHYLWTGLMPRGLLEIQFLTDEKISGEEDVSARLNLPLTAVRRITGELKQC